MIKINLLPEEYRKARRDYGEVYKKYKKPILILAGSAAGIVVFVSFLVIILPKLQQRTLGKLEARWKSFGKEYEEVSNLKRESKKLQDVQDSISKVEKERVLWAKKLNDISDCLPPEIQLTEIITQRQKLKETEEKRILTISGIVPLYPGEKAISEFIKGVSEIPAFIKDFPNIEPPSTETTKEGLKKFTLKCYAKIAVKEKKKKAVTQQIKNEGK